MARHEEHKEEQAKAEKESALVKVKFLQGTDADGKPIYRETEAPREIAEAELAKPVKIEDVKEGQPVKLRNSAYIGAEIVK